MSIPSFRTYLQEHARAPRKPVGDFVRDARTDDTFPGAVTSWAQLRDYLDSQNACEDCYPAAKTSWQHYLSWRRVAR